MRRPNAPKPASNGPEWLSIRSTLIGGTPAQHMRTTASGSKSKRRIHGWRCITRESGATGYTRKPHIESRIANDSVLIHTQTCVR